MMSQYKPGPNSSNQPYTWQFGIALRIETISRVLEFGLMHPVSDIVKTYGALMNSATNVVQ